MSHATLTIEPRPDLGDRVKSYVVDCRHGTSTAITNGPPAFPDSVIVAYLLERHDAEEGCACTRELRHRYGFAEVSSSVRR